MARREWAEQLYEKAQRLKEPDDCTVSQSIYLVLRLLKNEHARAVRIVKRAKRLELHGLRDTDTNEFLGGYEAACVDILAALSKGRA